MIKLIIQDFKNHGFKCFEPFYKHILYSLKYIAIIFGIIMMALLVVVVDIVMYGIIFSILEIGFGNISQYINPILSLFIIFCIVSLIIGFITGYIQYSNHLKKQK